MEKTFPSVETIYHTENTRIWMDEYRVLRVHIIGDEIGLEEVKQCFDIYTQLGCSENKVLQLLYAEHGANLTNEAKDYVNTRGKEFFLASAIISDSLAIRMLVNFFNFFYRTEVPFKMFAKERDALEWLNKYKEI